MKKRVVILSLAGCLVVLILGATLYLHFKYEPESQGNNYKIEKPCIDTSTTDLVSRATTVLRVGNEHRRTEIASVADEVTKYDKYKTDIHCMQIVTSRYIEEGDIELAKLNLEILKGLVDSAEVEPLGYDQNFRTIPQMEDFLAYFDELKSQIEKNNPQSGQSRIHEKVQ